MRHVIDIADRSVLKMKYAKHMYGEFQTYDETDPGYLKDPDPIHSCGLDL